MNSALQPQPQITTYFNRRVRAGDFPSAVYLVWEKGEAVFTDAVGHAVVNPYRIAVSRETIYDLASLTKPLITSLLCSLRLMNREFNLDDPVSRFLPEFNRSDKSNVTLKHLLTHTSGLPAWRPLYILANSPDDALSHIAAERFEYRTGTRVVYSDLGFIVLGLLLERTSGQSFIDLAREEIFRPLNLRNTYFKPEAALQTGIAACEIGNAYERQTCEQSGSREYQGWRQGIIWGEVHDGNAYFLGGSAGHAGLFSNGTETAKLAQQFLGSWTVLLDQQTCELFQTDFTPGLNESRSIGWQLASTPQSTAGPSLPANSFGHTGFTGTSCWVDPQNQRIFVLLTNRTHARPLPFANINEVRREFHTLAVQSLTDRPRENDDS